MSALELPEATDLDLRRQSPDEAWASLQEALAAAPAPTALELRWDQDLAPLHARLEEAHPERYDWWPLERQAPWWRARVEPRPATRDGSRLQAHFSRDHRRIRGLFDAVHQTLEGGDRQVTAAAFAELDLGITRHAAAEERLLFPLFESSRESEVTEELERLRQEHRAIGRLLEDIRDLLGAEERFDQPLVTAALGYLWQRVQHHEAREERTFLPLCDRLARPDEGGPLVTEAQKF